jgi:hypothetical protein
VHGAESDSSAEKLFTMTADSNNLIAPENQRTSSSRPGAGKWLLPGVRRRPVHGAESDSSVSSVEKLFTMTAPRAAGHLDDRQIPPIRKHDCSRRAALSTEQNPAGICENLWIKPHERD